MTGKKAGTRQMGEGFQIGSDQPEKSVGFFDCVEEWCETSGDRNDADCLFDRM